MKKNLNDKLLTSLLLIFILIQSIMDLHFLSSYNSIQILGFTIPTLIRLTGIFLIFLLLLTTVKIRKYLPFLILYLLTVLIYFYFHHKNALSFTSLVPGDFSYNILEEIFYIIRLLIPIFIAFVSYVTHVKEKDFEKLIFYIILFISGTIVISNLFKIGYGSYNNNIVEGNIINWFYQNNYDFYKYATKGWFANANAISSMLVLLFPFVLYFNVAKKNLAWFLLLIMQMLSMMMIGTKVATWGVLLELFVFIIIYLFFIFIKKEIKFDYKIMVRLFSVGICFFIIYPFSPCYQRIKTDQKRFIYSDQEEKIKLVDFYNELDTLSPDERVNFKIKFIENELDNFSINPTFIEKSYNYKYDPDFWITIFESDYQSRTNFRLLEEKMFKRLKEIDHRDSNDTLGLTYSRLSKVFNLEKDFVYQYYTLGFIGFFLLVFIYIFSLIYISIKILFINKKQFNLKNIIFLLGMSVCLAAAYMSGNVIDTLMVMILLSFLLGYQLRIINNN